MANKINTVDSSSYGPIHDTTIEKGDIVLDAAAKAGHKVTRIYGYNSTPDHNNLKCIDFMHYGNTAMRDWLVDYLKKNADVLGVAGIISNRRVMGFPENDNAYYRGPRGGWRTYTGPNPHTDHVHVQFDRSAVKGKATAPAKASGGKAGGYKKPTSGEVYLDKLHPGTKNSDSVYYWQMAMNAISFKGGSELKLTGNYNAALVHETKLFQDQSCNDPQDGWPGPKQSTYGFELAKKEMKSKGVKTLSIYKDSATGGLVKKVW